MSDLSRTFSDMILQSCIIKCQTLVLRLSNEGVELVLFFGGAGGYKCEKCSKLIFLTDVKLTKY